ncbi:ParB/RepB/Spo0J family partition protein [Fusicatenibacter saccharivorans]|uniref:ParB/RepB/Spo0J family partition protein n=1 Tax=Fusicatenibacter saccharivorans TaxID=1150298 RepID=UPI003F893879
MQKKGVNVSLTSYDDIFSTEQDRTAPVTEEIRSVPLSQLHPFKDHPFKVLDDDAMSETVESVKQIGVVVPLIARPAEDGYEIVSGHRRHHAAELAGLETVPVIVREMDDDSAVIFMVDSNLQRENILPSEKALAYKMKMDAMERKAGRPARDNSGQVGRDFKGKETREIIAEEAGESPRQVQRYIRLTNLIPEVLDMVDQKQIAFNPAVELSYLKPEEQQDFLEAIDMTQTAPSLSQAQRIKKLSQEGACTAHAICDVMSEAKKPEVGRLTFSTDSLRKYFPKSYTAKQMEETIIRLLEQYMKKRQRDMER